MAMIPLYSPLTFDENAKRIGTVTFSAMLYASRGAALACDTGIVLAIWMALGGFRTWRRRSVLQCFAILNDSEIVVHQE
jgi:hypothetical protein